MGSVPGFCSGGPDLKSGP